MCVRACSALCGAAGRPAGAAEGHTGVAAAAEGADPPHPAGAAHSGHHDSLTAHPVLDQSHQQRARGPVWRARGPSHTWPPQLALTPPPGEGEACHFFLEYSSNTTPPVLNEIPSLLFYFLALKRIDKVTQPYDDVYPVLPPLPPPLVLSSQSHLASGDGERWSW